MEAYEEVESIPEKHRIEKCESENENKKAGLKRV